MEIINFQCSHCGNMMGVTVDCLGQEVRCPTCEQVVVAPSGATEPSPREPAAVGSHDHEDIFSPPETDGLFGSEPAPRLEMPPASPSSNGPPVDQTPHLALEPSPEPAPAVASPDLPKVVVGTPVNGGHRTEPFSDTSAAGPRAGADYGDEPGDLPTAPPSSRRKPQRSSIVPILVIFSLLSYAIVVTVVAIVLYLRVKEGKSYHSPLDELPDVDGDAHGVTVNGHAYGVKNPNFSWEVSDQFKLEMPDSLKVGLGEKLQVGDLEIEPLRVERRRVNVLVEKSPKPEKMEFDSVVLHLRLRNTSSGARFVPLDPYFDRGMPHPGVVPERPALDAAPEALARYEEANNKYWEKWLDKRILGNPHVGPPLTLLEVGKRRYFGSSSDWYERNRDPSLRLRRAWVEGRKDNPEYLNPGMTMETFVSTDGRDPRLQQQLKTYHGPLLYRVHLRRGLVKRSDGKLFSATAVVGVRFTTDDI